MRRTLPLTRTLTCGRCARAPSPLSSRARRCMARTTRAAPAQDGRTSDGLNLQTRLPRRPGGADIARVEPPKAQPRAKLQVGSPAHLSDDEDASARARTAFEDELPRTVTRVIRTGGEWRVVCLGD